MLVLLLLALLYYFSVSNSLKISQLQRASMALWTECWTRTQEIWAQIPARPWKLTEGGHGKPFLKYLSYLENLTMILISQKHIDSTEHTQI